MEHCPIMEELAVQERKAQIARKAIGKKRRKAARLREELRRVEASIEATRKQQLERANARIADILFLLEDIG